MAVSYHCDVPECFYGWRGPAYLRDKVAIRHMCKRHEALAEAVAIISIDLPPPLIVERDVGCTCPMEVYDPECVVHVLDANW